MPDEKPSDLETVYVVVYFDPETDDFENIEGVYKTELEAIEAVGGRHWCSIYESELVDTTEVESDE